MKEHFNANGEALKMVFSFPSDDRTSLQETAIDSEISIPVEDKRGKVFEIMFCVTRSVNLGKKAKWIYGKVLNAPGGAYYQIEIKLHKGQPKSDTVEVFLQAPPSIINKLR